MGKYSGLFDDNWQLPTPEATGRFSNLFDEEEEQDEGFKSNIIASFGIGSNNLLGTVGNIYGLVTGDMDNAATRQAARGVEFYEQFKTADLSEKQRGLQEYINQGDGEVEQFGRAVWGTVSDLDLLTNFVVEQVPMAVVGGAAGKGVAAATNSIRAGTATGIGTSAALQGGDVGGGVYDDLIKLPDEIWDQNPEFKALSEEVGRQEAKSEIALGAARKAGAISLAISGVTGFLPNTLEKALVKGVEGDGFLQRGLKGFASEGLQESLEEGGGQIASNFAAQPIDTERGLFEGVGQAVGQGGLLGGLIGGAVGVLSPAARMNQESERARSETVNAGGDALDGASAAAAAAADVAGTDTPLRQRLGIEDPAPIDTPITPTPFDPQGPLTWNQEPIQVGQPQPTEQTVPDRAGPASNINRRMSPDQSVADAILLNERELRAAESAGDVDLANEIYEEGVQLRQAQRLYRQAVEQERQGLDEGNQSLLDLASRNRARANDIMRQDAGRRAAFNEPFPEELLRLGYDRRQSLEGQEPLGLPDRRFDMPPPAPEPTPFDGQASARAGNFDSPVMEARRRLREFEPVELDPEVTYAGATGAGFATEKGANTALKAREKAQPDYDWTVRQDANGRYELFGTIKPDVSQVDGQVEDDTQDPPPPPAASPALDVTPDVTQDDQVALDAEEDILTIDEFAELTEQELEDGFDMLDDQVDFSPRRPSDVADIGAAREARDLRNFRKDFMEKVRQGAAQDAAMAQTLKESGAYDGLEIGDTYITTSQSGKKFRNRVVGLSVSRVGPSDRKGFAEFGPIPESEIIEGPDGKQYKAVLRVESINEDGDVTQSSSNMYRLKELGYQRMGGLRATEEGVDFSPRRDTRRLDMNFRDVNKRVPELTEAAQQLRRGEITREQYAQKVNEFKPVTPYDFIPEPASQEEIFDAISEDKRSRIDAEVEEGAKVGLRLDIPAYTRKGTWVPTIHRTIDGKDVPSYRSTAAVSNVNFPKFSEASLRIAEGTKNKETFARIRGEFINRTEDENVALAQEALNSPDWIQVGMDPERTGYFYDRNDIETRVVSAEEVIQIGPLVLAKNAVTEPAGDLMFSNRRDGDDGGRDYRLNIDRQERTTGSRKRLPKEEAELIRQEAAKLKLSEEQVKSLAEEAVRVKNQYPESDGWAPLKLSGITESTNDKGEVTYDLKWQEEAYGYNKRSSEKKAKSKMDKEYAIKVAEKFTGLVEDIYKRAESGDKNAETIISHQTWYRNVTEILRREFGGSADMFADLLGATSPNTPVDTNFKFSVDIMRRFARGDFNRELAAYDKWVKEGKADKKFPDADKIRQVSEKLYGMNSINAQKALLDMWRILKPGTAPKARNFALNLIGQSDMATIDVWAARMLRRAANMIRGNNLKRIPPPAEKGVTGKWNSKATEVTGEFGFGAAVMDIAVQKLKRKGINVTAPDLQAIAWFAEKELWSKNNWTTKTGEGGSFEENFDAVPTERYVAGWSIQQGEKAPTDEQMTEAQQRVLSALLDDSSVITARAMPTFGLYAGETERSFDTEWTVDRGAHNPSKVIQAIAQVSQENNQYDIFVSRVVSPEEQNQNARPGVELYFRNQQDLEQVMPTLEAFTSKGVDGFTLVVDPRNSSGDGYIGVRLQFVPEISARWDEDFRAEALADGGIERIIEEKRDQLNDIVRDLRAEGRVAYANQFDYDTVVAGIENYGEYTNAESGEVDLSTGGQVRLGRSVRQGLEGAVARYEGEQRQDGTGSVPDVGSELQPEVDDDARLSPRRQPRQPASLDTALGRVRQALSGREGSDLDDAGITIVLPDAIPRERRDAVDFARQAARAFQKSDVLNFVEFAEGVTGFNGATVSGQIFIDVNAENPYHVVLGHELTHVLRRDYPDLYQQLEDMIIPQATAREDSARQHGFDMDSQRGREEYVSDVVGNRFGETEFWQAMAEANPKGFRMIAQVARSLMQKLADFFRIRSVAVGDGVSDLNKVRAEVAKVMNQYKDRLDQDAKGQIPDQQIPSFMRSETTQNSASVNDGETMFSPRRNNNYPLRPAEETLVDKFIRTFQDKMVPLKRTQQAIEETEGRKLDVNEDPYGAEERFSGKTEEDLRQIRVRLLDPFTEDLVKSGIKLSDLDRYLIARHAPERNAYIASINDQMPDGGSGMTNAEAAAVIREVNASGKRADYERLANKVYEMTQLTRDLIRSGGLETDEVVSTWQNQYQNYVPLRGFADEQLEAQTGSGTGRGFDIRGREARRALGRESLAKSPTSQVMASLTEKVIRNRKNEVGKTFLNMVENHPDPAMWEVFTDDNPDTEQQFINGRVTEAPVRMANSDKYFAVKRDGKVHYIKVKDQRLLNAMQNVGPTELDAVTRVVAPVTRFLASMFTSYNPQFVATNFVRDIQTAAINLAAEGSMEGGKIEGEKLVGKVVAGTPKAIAAIRSANKRDAVNDDTDPSASEYRRYYQEFLNDGAKTGYFDSPDVDRIAKSLEERMRASEPGAVNSMKRGLNEVMELTEKLNSAVENGVRLSAYIEARKAGVDRAKAASLAKNMTVNFNRKGEVGSALNSWYMFFNAAVQGTTQFLRTLSPIQVNNQGNLQLQKRMNLAQKIAGGIVASSVGFASMMRDIGGEDDDGEAYWDKIPPAVRERNLVIMKPGTKGDYYKFPLPYGYNFFWNMGDSIEGALNGSKVRGDRVLGDLVSSFVTSFSPFSLHRADTASQQALLTASPSIALPVAELATNTDYFGERIMRENFPGGAQKSRAAMYFPSTKEPYVQIAKFLNESLGGGSEYRSGDLLGISTDFSPDAIQHIVEYAGGGLLRTATGAADSLARPLMGRQVQASNVPFARTFVGRDQSDYGDLDTFYDRRQQIMDARKEYMDAPDYDAKRASDEGFNGIRRLYPQANSAYKALQRISDQQDRVRSNDRLSAREKDDQLEELRIRKDDIVDRFNRRYNEFMEQ